MLETTLCPGNLVLYKQRPALVRRSGAKLEIELKGGKSLKVRPKDITLLHPGPVKSLSELQSPPGEIETAWEILAGSTTTIAELAELVYGVFTPSTAWAAWQLIADALYFHGTPQKVFVRTPEQVAQQQAARQAQSAKKEEWAAFLERVRAGRIISQDSRHLKEVEDLALGLRAKSRLLRELGHTETPENAHALLLKLGLWTYSIDPYPQRLGLSIKECALALPNLPDEDRRDLTHLMALAIDDKGCQDPDDALSLEGNRLWIHVADVAALAPPGSPIDLEARARGASLYLPEGTVPMLPPKVIQFLGLGLAEISPALSFALDLDPKGEIVKMQVVPSRVRVTRLSYKEAETRLDEEPLQSLHRLAQAWLARRREKNAIMLDFPEVKIRVQDEKVVIRPLPPLNSRVLVREAMLVAGEAAARFALEKGIPFPFSTQAHSETSERPTDLAGMHALRRTLKPAQRKNSPAPHAALGLEVYSQTTSPLRRYLDLVVHQQLRLYLCGKNPLSAQEVLERVGAAGAITGSVRQAERLANRHWTLVYLMQHPDWRGEGILIEKRGPRGRFLIPELGLECLVHLRQDLSLNSVQTLVLGGVNLGELEVHFQVEAGQ